MDVKHLSQIRINVRNLIKNCATVNDVPGIIVLDIAQQEHQGVKEIYRLLKFSIISISIPFNFIILEVSKLDWDKRDLMPIHYTLIAEKI